MGFLLLLAKILFTVLSLGLVSILAQLSNSLILKPQRLRSKLWKQGIRGPPPSFLLGNILQIKKIQSNELSNLEQAEGEEVITHNCSSFVLPFLSRWREQYGPTFMFSLGNIQILHLNHPDTVKEISKCISLDLGKPSSQEKHGGPLFGQGVLTSNGEWWSHQRKMLASELYMDKVKGMMNLMTECSITLVTWWKSRIEEEGGVADLKIDDDLRRFSGDVISRACFGSNYRRGEEILIKLRALQKTISRNVLPHGLPVLRHLPTKNNREIWRLEKEIRTLVLKAIYETKEETSKQDLLQRIFKETEASNLSHDATHNFIVDNVKTIYLAGYETMAVVSAWTLMLLASNPEWQEKARAEVCQVCEGKLPNADMIHKMKLLNMVIHESLRLYPPGPMVPREALKDMKFGDIYVPEGVNIWTFMVTLHQDPEIWGPDAYKFNPQRFADGISGACKFPHLYMPFGVGPRLCLGQHFAMVELKILLGLLLSNFTFSLSPKYKHSPTLSVIIEPRYGVDLLIKKL